MTVDDLKAAFPDLGVAVYWLGQTSDGVTVELITPAGRVFSYKAACAELAIEQAYREECRERGITPGTPLVDAWRAHMGFEDENAANIRESEERARDKAIKSRGPYPWKDITGAPLKPKAKKLFADKALDDKATSKKSVFD